MKQTVLEDLQAATSAFTEIQLPPTDTIAHYNLVVGRLHQLIVAILACEEEGLSKEEILNCIAPAKAFHSDSPFIRRCQTWPRGFPGDYETIEYLYAAKNHATPHTLGYYCEEYALLSPSTQQHRNKLLHQAQLIVRCLQKAQGQPIRVLSLASGSSLELQWIQPVLQAAPVEFVLNDTEQDALDFAREKLKSIQDKCTFMPGNVVEFLAWEADELGAFDLVLTGGLFDYLEDKHILFVLKHAMRSLLKPGGTLFFTNVAKGNPYRPWMEYLADWTLIERDEDALKVLLEKSNFRPEDIHIQRDTTRLTCLVELTKQSDLPS